MLNVPTVLLQWAVGGLLFLWVTTRRREVGLGYGWLMRGTFGIMAIGAIVTAPAADVPGAILVGASLVTAATAFAFAVSIAHRSAGVLHQREQSQARSARVAAMTGIERETVTFDLTTKEFPPIVDLFAPVLGLLALPIAGLTAGDGSALLAFRLVVGSLFLGAATDAMLLGHWYLVQPGLPRDALKEMVNWLIYLTPVEVIAYLIPVGMISAINGTISDGYDGILTWFWVLCSITTLGLAIVGKAALKEKQYSAVMATTGLTYLSILTAFGTDLIARAILT